MYLNGRTSLSPFTLIPVRTWEAKATKLEDKMRVTAESESDKVEKGLIKNLVIGYLTAPNNGKGQILKLLSAVLDFTPAEADKTGVNKTQSGWLGGLLHSSGASGGENPGNEGLAQAFVQFLEQESRPVRADTGAALLNMMSTNSGQGLASGGPRKESVTSAVNPSEPHTLMMASNASLEHSFVPTRNSSSILKDVLSDS